MMVTSNIRTVIRQVRAYRDRLSELTAEVVRKLIAEGEIVARSEVIAIDAVYTGNLANSIDHFFDAATNTGFIRCNADTVIFVEFGTGIIGKENPYPGTAMAAVGYQVRRRYDLCSNG